MEILYIDVGSLTLSRIGDLNVQLTEVGNGVRDIRAELTKTKDGISTLILSHTDETLMRAID